jgi:hypothetical protein
VNGNRYTGDDGVARAVLPCVPLDQHVQNFQQIAATPVSSRDIPTIKAWRKARYEAGLPSELKDFYAVNGFCFQCNGTGWKSEDGCDRSSYRFRACSECNGTGKAVQS